jgi:hypothetical protein
MGDDSQAEILGPPSSARDAVREIDYTQQRIEFELGVDVQPGLGQI